jgi:hypothetical protein
VIGTWPKWPMENGLPAWKERKLITALEEAIAIWLEAKKGVEKQLALARREASIEGHEDR